MGMTENLAWRAGKGLRMSTNGRWGWTELYAFDGWNVITLFQRRVEGLIRGLKRRVALNLGDWRRFGLGFLKARRVDGHGNRIAEDAAEAGPEGL
jgi:hypothetical protein